MLAMRLTGDFWSDGVMPARYLGLLDSTLSSYTGTFDLAGILNFDVFVLQMMQTLIIEILVTPTDPSSAASCF